MKKFLAFLFLMALSGAAMFAQENIASPAGKPAIPMRPNSRDYAPVRRTNDHQRLDPVRRRQIMREARLNWQKKALLKQGNKLYYRREIIMKQRSTIIRNRLRR